MHNTKARLQDMFTLDYRSLALLRIGMGITIICDLIQRSENLRVHYTESVILPRASLFYFFTGFLKQVMSG